MANLIGDKARALALPLAKQAAGLVTRAIPIPRPTLLVGPGSSRRLAEAIAGFGHRRVFVVADPVLAKLGLVDPSSRPSMPVAVATRSSTRSRRTPRSRSSSVGSRPSAARIATPSSPSAAAR